MQERGVQIVGDLDVVGVNRPSSHGASQGLEPASYYEKLPPLEGRQVLLLDPMLATGGSAARACTSISRRSPARILFVCVVAAPEGIARMERDHPDVPIFTAAIDRELNANGYILPGLGDFGDRLFGTEPHAGIRAGASSEDEPD